MMCPNEFLSQVSPCILYIVFLMLLLVCFILPVQLSRLGRGADWNTCINNVYKSLMIAIPLDDFTGKYSYAG